MGNHAMTSTSGSSNIFPQEMQSNHSLIAPSSPTRGQLKASPSTSSSDKAERPQPRALSHLLPAQPEVGAQNYLNFPSTAPAKHPWCLPELLMSLRGIHHLSRQHQSGIFLSLLQEFFSPFPTAQLEDSALDKIFHHCFSWISQCLIIFAVVCK